MFFRPTAPRPARSLAMICAGTLLLVSPLAAQKFYPDDPLDKEPPPIAVGDANIRELSGILELAHSFKNGGDRHPNNGVIPAMGVNTLDEVPDGPWYVNRHGRSRMTAEELARGAGADNPPKANRTWEVLTVKRFGNRPGMLISDGGEDLYLLRFDPPGHLEMMTGAEIVSSRFFFALGYWTPADYLVYFERDHLRAAETGSDVTSLGEGRKLLEEDIDRFLKDVAKDPVKGYRAVAHRIRFGVKLLGPFQLHGTRSDDPNDLVPHEHRRELRGLRVFSAWLNHYYFSPLATMDTLGEYDGIRQFRHLLVDFVGTLGSGYRQQKGAREGNEPYIDPNAAARNLFTFGAYFPRWERADYPAFPSIGRFESEVFDPEQWTTNYSLAPFENMLPDDAFWAAKQVMAFTGDDIRTIVETGQYSNPEARTWLVNCLIQRRDKIGRSYWNKVLPLDHFRIEAGELLFDNLAVAQGFSPSPSYTLRWSEFQNFENRHVRLGTPLKDQFQLPPAMAEAPNGAYFAAEISADEPEKTVTVYLRKEEHGSQVVGVERSWPGKIIAHDERAKTPGVSRYPDLSSMQKELFDEFARKYAQDAGRKISPQQYFDEIPYSQQTTFEAVTNALMNSRLTDSEGRSLGTAIELVNLVERIAGMAYGRGGDEQFRVYFTLKAHARETLEKSQQFIRDKDNTVYHVGYPLSYRQGKSPPSVQFSMADDGSRVDVDVDYRTSKLPQSLWNGHLTASNSDVRAGNNYQIHTGKWSGLVNWWTRLFGQLPDEETERSDLFKEPPEPPSPVPPNRPLGATIPEVEVAMQEFLTDWLVRHNFNEAMEFVSPNALACVNIDKDEENEILSASEARQQLRNAMRHAVGALGAPRSLTEVIDEFRPWRNALRVVEHPYGHDFTIVEVPDEFAKAFRCEQRSEEEQKRALEGSNLRYGNYYGTIFRFKVKGNRGGVLGILWTKEDAAWRIVSWEAYDQ